MEGQVKNLGINRFCDIPTYRQRKGKLSRNVFLFAPHGNELGAVLGFQKALADRLEGGGVRTEVLATRQITHKCWEIRREIGRNPGWGGGQEVLNDMGGVMAAYDMWLRSGEIARYFAKYPNESMALEMHAASSNPKEGTRVEHAEKWRRIPGTKIVISDFFRNIQWKRKVNERRFLDLPESRIAREMARIIGVPFSELVNATIETLERLKRMAFEVMTVELPARSVPLPKGHSMHKYYFENGGEDKISSFEANYAVWTRQNVGFSQEEVDAVASILVLPPKKD